MSATYSTNEVCDMAGVTYRQLDYWCREGLVAPAVGGGKGPGTFRRWAPRQVAAVTVLGQVAALNQLGSPLAQLAPLAQFLDDLPLRHWSTTRVMLDDEGQVWRINQAGTPRVGTYVDVAVAIPVIGLIASKGHRSA